MLEQAASFYERVLWESEAGAGAREYLASRGLEETTCREFELGLSPRGATLAHKARDKGFTSEELAAAGLVTRRGTDYFQRRLMFPLADARGEVIGFQARKLQDDVLAREVHQLTRGDLFHKSNVLYGLHLARGAIASRTAPSSSRNTDAIALRQAGLEPVVASMGTALTERQLPGSSG